MTNLLRKAFEEASKLPELEQNVLARWLIEEINSEKEWKKAFSESESILDELANEAIKEYEEGKTKLLDATQL